jgi:hypothetical protein
MVPHPVDSTKRNANRRQYLTEKKLSQIFNDVITIILHETGENARPSPGV